MMGSGLPSSLLLLRPGDEAWRGGRGTRGSGFGWTGLVVRDAVRGGEESTAAIEYGSKVWSSIPSSSDEDARLQRSCWPVSRGDTTGEGDRLAQLYCDCVSSSSSTCIGAMVSLPVRPVQNEWVSFSEGLAVSCGATA